MRLPRAGFLTVFLLSFLTLACHKRTAYAPAAPPPPETILGEADSFQQSLFKGDQAVLSDRDIDKILGTQVNFIDRHRLAVLSLTPVSPWSEDLADTETKSFEKLIQLLGSSSQLTQVRLLPSLLVPEKRTVPYLREAAARVQADLLFLYAARIQSFQRDRFLKPGEVRARCIAESVLLDVRTGIVLHTGRATESIQVQKVPTDLNFGETVARAESDAREKALLALAKDLLDHLAEATKSPAPAPR